ncbi:hypothetical protein GCM10027347_08730 [Larkinella harenae]
MKTYICRVLGIALAVANGTGTPGFSQTMTPERVLNRVARGLTSREVLHYQYHRELHYFSEDIHHKLDGACYLDFTASRSVLGFRYQFSDSDMISVYNGTEKFEGNKRNRTLRVNPQPRRADFESLSFFYNSPATLRLALPAIISDQTIPKTVKDTVIQAHHFYAVTFGLQQKTLGYLGDYRPLTQDRMIQYRLMIDPKTFLPVEVIQSNNRDQDFTKTSFQYLDATAAPADSSWYYSSYQNDYQLTKPEADQQQLISVGQPAPDWTLPVLGADEAVSLNQLKGKVVLLEFWIRNCAYCVASVPKLNALFERLNPQDFRLLAINPYDSKETVAVFKQKIQPTYPLLYDGQEVAKKYGVGQFPVVVLIDKTGQIIYSGGYEPDKVAGLIEAAMR